MDQKPNTLILFLGNPLFSDDKIGLVLGEKLRDQLVSLGLSVEIAVKTGFAIIDYMEGYDRVIIVDAIHTGKLRPGEVVVLPEDSIKGTSLLIPHYTGIPEALKTMRALGLSAPRKVFLIGVEVVDPYTISDKMTPEITGKLDEIIEDVKKEIISLLELSP